ncbi:substrate carrier protein, partial [Tanacetum coccineum]
MEEFIKNNKTFAIHLFSGAGALTLGTAVTYPFDTIKTLIQVGSGPDKQLSASQVFNRVRKLSGYSGLYNGLGWLALGRISGVGARFGTYELLTAFYKMTSYTCKNCNILIIATHSLYADVRQDNYVYVSEALMPGIAAGAVESLMSSPFELFTIRSQVTTASRVPKSSTALEITSASSSIAKVLRGYTPDV